MVDFAGSGTLSVGGTPAPQAQLGLSGSGQLQINGFTVPVNNARLMILDDTLIQAPTALTVVVDGGWPSDDVQFDIDGTVVRTATLDSVGGLAPMSIAVSEALGAMGVHTLTMTSLTLDPGYTQSATFTIDREPNLVARVVGPDAEPVAVPAAQTSTGVYRWVFQDLMPGGLGSYVLPANPTTMSAPHFQRLLSQTHTTAVDSGRFHVSEVAEHAVEWEFAGFCATQVFHDKLLAYFDLKRRFYVIDHRNRAWKVAFTSVDLVARKRSDVNGALTDWAHDYTVRALIYDQDWAVPQ